MTSPRRCPRRWPSSSAAARPPGSTCAGSASTRRSRRWSRPRSSSRRSSRRASPCSPRCARAGSSRTTWSGTPSASSRRSRPAESVGVPETIALVRERGLAMAEAARERPGSMAAILGLEDEVVERDLPQDPRGLAGELQLPGPDRRLRRARRRRRVLREGRGGGRAPHGQAEGLRRLPLPARRACRRAAAARRSRRCKFSEPQAAFMSTVTARFEEAQRMGALLVDQLTAPVRFTQAASGARQGRRPHVRRGRAGQRALGARQADRPQREGGLRQRPRLAREGRRGNRDDVSGSLTAFGPEGR